MAHGVRVFDSPQLPAEATALGQLRSGLRGVDLAAPAIVLPDFHHKGDKEMPSSIAVATSDAVWPVLTSASVNCGMALVATDLERPPPRAIARFYRGVRKRYPYPPTFRRELTREEVVRCAADGGSYAIERFGLEPSVLERVEEGGCLDVSRFGGSDRVRHELPWSVVQLSRIRFGTIGPSNHFIEFQEVEEVLDEDAASALGVEQGQVTLQYHGGGGSLPGELGLLFGRRKRYPRAVRAQMAVQKPLYHFGRARSLAEIRRRRALYFSTAFPPVERDGPEGERLLLANAMAMNYGFAFRLAFLASVRELLRETFGPTENRLVVDSPHNSIYEEELNGERVVVHRHNAARAYPASRLPEHRIFGRTGQPLLLPGTSLTSSYLCTAGPDAGTSLYSACHGAGTSIAHFVDRGVSSGDVLGRTTQRHDYAGEAATQVDQLDDRGVDEVLGILRDAGIVRPVARLRPFAVLN